MRPHSFGSRFIAAALAGLLSCSLVSAAESIQAAAPASATNKTEHVMIRVQTAATVGEPLSGRLLIFLKPGTGAKEVDSDIFNISATQIAAKDVSDVAPGASVLLDADDIAFPAGFSHLPAGKYQAQAVLDVDRSYNYGGRNKKHWISDVVTINWTPGGAFPAMTLVRHPEEDPRRIAERKAILAKVKPDVVREEHFTSPLLSRFWGSPKQLNAWVILPPGYDNKVNKSYPTVYWTHGFGGNFDYSLNSGLKIRERMDSGQIPPMIWVMLDESIPQGTHEFADSVNNGPWGAALTTEFIPYLEQHYRMDAVANSRFLNGHSSGGWATLQLQVNYPKTFGGTWSTSPDPSDFHDFTGPNLYAPNANIYHRADGSDYPIMRMDGKVIATLSQFSRMEEVIGPYGGQIASFDWVFSPKGEDGKPLPMFNRQTGVVDPKVVAYWHDHYDLANIVQKNWATSGADLQGRIHLYVGTADTFYLDGAAHRMQAVLDGLNAGAQFTFLPGRSHFDVYAVGDDKSGLTNQIAKEMYAVARPGVSWGKP
ncbi:alpha/beta hydrolase [Solimicrobium silvestre]|uniref:Putative esterase n=1 Tax=Solimicrobium silvestre TaxID=2099400 RepID=A0A2S9GYP6_9BURK|nr:alpha/beta hydrolase-fold protein [Solimicrobium silvestre]PRC92844.1 putative esterase [Solimicrobium silvestre]